MGMRFPSRSKPGGAAGTLAIPEPGTHLLRIRRSAATRIESGFEALHLFVNAMPSARVIVEPAADVMMPGAITAYGAMHREADRTIAGWLGPVDKLEIRWPASTPPAAQRTMGMVEGLILWDINSAGDRIRARLTYNQPEDLATVRLGHPAWFDSSFGAGKGVGRAAVGGE